MGWQDILATAPEVDTRNAVHYHEVACQSVLNEVRAPDLPYDLSANPYLNCEFGCRFCFARDVAERRSQQAHSGAFERRIYAKPGAADRLDAELKRLARRGQLSRIISLGTATDPYQPLERRRRDTRALLERLVAAAERGPEPSPLRVAIATRSDAILADLDLLQRLNEHAQVRVHIGLNTLDRELLRSLEPRAPTPALRLHAVERLAAAGVPVGVHAMPVLPHLTDDSRTLRRLVCAAQQAGARYLTARILFLQGAARDAFLTWLAEARPSLVSLYRRHYRTRTPPLHVQERITGLVASLRRQYGLPADLPFDDRGQPPQQLDLFDAPRGRLLPSVDPDADGVTPAGAA